MGFPHARDLPSGAWHSEMTLCYTAADSGQCQLAALPTSSYCMASADAPARATTASASISPSSSCPSISRRCSLASAKSVCALPATAQAPLECQGQTSRFKIHIQSGSKPCAPISKSETHAGPLSGDSCRDLQVLTDQSCLERLMHACSSYKRETQQHFSPRSRLYAVTGTPKRYPACKGSAILDSLASAVTVKTS